MPGRASGLAGLQPSDVQFTSRTKPSEQRYGTLKWHRLIEKHLRNSYRFLAEFSARKAGLARASARGGCTLQDDSPWCAQFEGVGLRLAKQGSWNFLWLAAYDGLLGLQVGETRD